MKPLARLGAACLAAAVPAHAQHILHDMPGMQDMPGMAMPKPKPKPAPAPAPATGKTPAPAPPPSAPTDHYADRVYSADDMAAARRILAREHGGMAYHMLIADIAEWQVRRGRDGYRWEGEGWYGRDLDRLVVKTQGEADRGVRPDAEVSAYYSHAIDPYWNLQAGVRQDIRGRRSPTYASVAIEGLAPYWFETEGSLFLSQHGDLTGRISAYYDQRITQSLILQPRIELNLAAQDAPADRIGAGLSSAELDLRLRYEFRRQFAPYVGLSRAVRTGRTARFARVDGEQARSTSLVLGVRAWF